MYFYPTVHQFYDFGDATLLTTDRSMPEIFAHVENVSSLRNLIDLLSSIAPLPNTMYRPIRNIFIHLNARGFESVPVEGVIDLFAKHDIDSRSRNRLESYNRRADCLYDVLMKPSPRFVIVDFSMAHYPFLFDEKGNMITAGADDPMRYPAHHTFSVNTLLKFVDLILENDPEAVIILQADHGLHSLPWQIGVEGVMELFSCTAEEAVSIWHSVMSAVRLPDELMTPETERILSDPRNISRFLVNNFVGENYDYIPYEFRQIFKGPERVG